MIVHQQKAEPWKVTLVDTGEDTQTGGRLRRVKEYIKDDEIFCLTYGDGVSDINITELIAFHRSQHVKATLTAVLLADDMTPWEGAPLERLAHEGDLAAYSHQGFWHPMDTLRDKIHLEELWASGHAPWKSWV
jgi:glucose-1-phosphate cytidylyltransferase